LTIFGAPPLTVVKVGGSLYDLPDFRPRLRQWLATLQGASALLVPGGGKLVRAIRQAQSVLALNDETTHWLAARALRINARILAKLLEADTPREHSLPGSGIAILDCYEFLINDEGTPGCLPHSWSVTSDSIALRVAQLRRAAELILLKSVDIPAGLSWSQAAAQGLVDTGFSQVLERVCRPGQPLRVRAVNFRGMAFSAWPPDSAASQARQACARVPR
jgi:aspartokinase-like uncharacterized kinase